MKDKLIFILLVVFGLPAVCAAIATCMYYGIVGLNFLTSFILKVIA